MNGQLRVQDTSRDAELLQKQLEPVTAVYISDEHERLPLNQAELQEGVDEQELVLLLAPDAVLLELRAVGQLRSLELQHHLRQTEESVRSSQTHQLLAPMLLHSQDCGGPAPSGPGRRHSASQT